MLLPDNPPIAGGGQKAELDSADVEFELLLSRPERRNFSCLKLPGLQYFIVATLGRVSRLQLKGIRKWHEFCSFIQKKFFFLAGAGGTGA
jgi:hypothetical protein